MSFEEKNAALITDLLKHMDEVPTEFGPEMNDWAQRLQGFVSKGSGIARKYRRRRERCERTAKDGNSAGMLPP